MESAVNYLNKLEQLDRLVIERNKLQQAYDRHVLEMAVIEENIHALLKDIDVLERQILTS